VKKPKPNYIVDNETGCWNWNKHIKSNGYGVTSFRQKDYHAHRFYYEKFVSPIKKNMQIDHLCRNRKCVNPKHLEAVYQHENIWRGKSTKLTPLEVREIRGLIAAGKLKNKEIAPMYRVCAVAISDIKTRKSWSKLK